MTAANILDFLQCTVYKIKFLGINENNTKKIIDYNNGQSWHKSLKVNYTYMHKVAQSF